MGTLIWPLKILFHNFFPYFSWFFSSPKNLKILFSRIFLTFWFFRIDSEFDLGQNKKITQFSHQISFFNSGLVQNVKKNCTHFEKGQVLKETMMRLDSGGTATATASAQQAQPPSQASAAMSMSAMSASASSDFMGNQLASYFSQLFEKNPQEQVLQG